MTQTLNKLSTQVHLTLKCSNAKTGPIPVSTTDSTTCWSGCGMFTTCYAKSSHLSIHWRKVSNLERGYSWQEFCQSISNLPAGTLWRHNQAGDLPGVNHAIDYDELTELVDANNGKRGFTYTHKPVLDGLADASRNRDAIAYANAHGFTVNLSANNVRHADALADLDIAPVVTVLPATVNGNVKLTTPNGRKIVVCPATYRDEVTCASCQLCQRVNRQVIVGFPAHGSKKSQVEG